MNYYWSIPVSLLVVLSGCSSAENSSSTSTNASSSIVPETVRYLGVSHTSTFEQQSVTNFRSTFFGYSQDVSVDLLKRVNRVELYDAESLNNGPLCEIHAVGDDEITNYIPDEIDIEFVSAGDNLVLTAPQGTIADIEKLEESFISPIYFGQFNFSFPPDTQLAIPGDVYPAMTIPFPIVDSLESADFATERPTRLDEAFSWTPTDIDSVISLSFTDDPHKNWITCYSQDNGKFEFPENVIDQFGIDQPMVIRNMTRIKSSVHYGDNAMLIAISATAIFDN